MKHSYKDKITYFNNISARWDDIAGNDEKRFMKLREAFSLIALEPNATVLDAGCGTGILFPLIRERIGKKGHIIAVDASDKMIEEAKKRHSDDIRYFATPLEAVNLPGKSIDVLLMFAVFPHIEDKRRALFKCHHLLKTSGRLYIFHLADTQSLNEFHRSLDAPVRHDVMPEREELEKLFYKTGFALTRYIDQPTLNFIEAIRS